MASRSENLPVLPQVASKLLTMIDDPIASTRNIEGVVERDPAIVAKILKVAGSAFYGGIPAGTTSRAIAVLGMNTVKSLVVGLVFQQVVGNKSQSSRFDKVEFWRHSLAVASASKVIAMILKNPNAETLYFAGMMHDIGILVLDRFDRDEFDQALKRARDQGLTLAEAENLTYQFTHAQVGEILSKKWGLNLIQSNAVRYHHEPSTETCGLSESTAIVHLADVLAHKAGFKNQSPTAPQPELSPEILEFLKIPEAQIEPIELAVTKEVAKMTELFGVAA